MKASGENSFDGEARKFQNWLGKFRVSSFADCGLPASLLLLLSPI